jgi:uncharacterized repeat protein (TIGR04052 family)
MNRCSVRAGAGNALILLPALGLITGLATSCTRSGSAEVQLRFELAADPAASNANVRNLQFYIHEVELLDEHGKPRPFRFAAAPPWQSERVALLDLAGGSATQRRVEIHGTPESAAVAAYSGIRFTVGVPFELNHADALAAAAPLNRAEMFWNWQSGYKFLRVDLAVEDHEWSFHLGATGCSSASALRPPAAQCAQPNLVRVELRGDPLRNVVRFHLEPLVAAAHSANYAICTGNYADDPACANAYASTGLHATSGECSDRYCLRQLLWTLD